MLGRAGPCCSLMSALCPGTLVPPSCCWCNGGAPAQGGRGGGTAKGHWAAPSFLLCQVTKATDLFGEAVETLLLRHGAAVAGRILHPRALPWVQPARPEPPAPPVPPRPGGAAGGHAQARGCPDVPQHQGPGRDGARRPSGSEGPQPAQPEFVSLGREAVPAEARGRRCHRHLRHGCGSVQVGGGGAVGGRGRSGLRLSQPVGRHSRGIGVSLSWLLPSSQGRPTRAAVCRGRGKGSSCSRPPRPGCHISPGLLVPRFSLHFPPQSPARLSQIRTPQPQRARRQPEVGGAVPASGCWGGFQPAAEHTEAACACAREGQARSTRGFLSTKPILRAGQAPLGAWGGQPGPALEAGGTTCRRRESWGGTWRQLAGSGQHAKSLVPMPG